MELREIGRMWQAFTSVPTGVHQAGIPQPRSHQPPTAELS